MKKRMTFTLDEELLKELKELSDRTMIPQSRLVEKAIKNIIKEYDN
ncbi:ribbon-helix-helix domain-containing protein [Liquorilactobacillus capillatus]|nr:ribbon-helix-helix domain-containing protein [Liquorilactobacillus capillatus]